MTSRLAETEEFIRTEAHSQIMPIVRAAGYLLRASKDAGRSCFVKFHNMTGHRLVRRRYAADVGKWTPECEPPETIYMGERNVPFGTESTGYMSGTQGTVTYGLQHPRYGNLKCVFTVYGV